MTDAVLAARPQVAVRSWFYVWMAAAIALTAFVGFTPTYWLQVPAGTFTGSPLLHLHALLFSAWTLFFLSQTMLAALGKLESHRAWGLLGVSLATAVVLVGMATTNETLARRIAAGYGDQARAFSIVTHSMMLMFAGFVAAALANVSRPEVHKRLMLLATVTLLPPVIVRIFFAFSVGIAPGLRPGLGAPRAVESVITPALVADAFLIAAILYDMRTRGRPHPVYLIGGGIILAVQVLRIPLSGTSWWHGVADFLLRFSG